MVAPIPTYLLDSEGLFFNKALLDPEHIQKKSRKADITTDLNKVDVYSLFNWVRFKIGVFKNAVVL